MIQKYRYYETAYAIINSLIDSAFTACRYAVCPDESEVKYFDRMSVTNGLVAGVYLEDIVVALRGIVESPELCGSDEDLYEVYSSLLQSTLYNIAKDLPIAAYELNVDKIREYFKRYESNSASETVEA
jgi:hypothetical protein